MLVVFEIVIFVCILGLGLTRNKLAAKLKIQAKMIISKTARFFYLIFVWELLLNTYRGPGCAQFEWTIFLNWRWLLKRCARSGLSGDPSISLAEVSVLNCSVCHINPVSSFNSNSAWITAPTRPPAQPSPVQPSPASALSE